MIGAAGLLSRILGVFRDRLLASEFGASRELDIYYAAFQIPDLLHTVFLLGAAAAAIIPILLDLRGKNESDAREFLAGLILVFSSASVILSGIAFVAMPYIVGLIAPGFSASEHEFLVRLSRIMLLSPLFLGLSSVLSSAIQSARLFGIYALTGIFYNIGIIAGIFFFLPAFGLPGLALGVSLGAFLHFAIQIPSFYRLGFRFPSFRDIRSFSLRVLSQGPFRRVYLLSLPRVLTLSLWQLTFVAFVAIASTLLSGSIAVLQFAYNLQYIPVGVFGLSFAVATFPRLCEYAAARDSEKWTAVFSGSVRTIFFWVTPIAVLFYVLRAQIVRVALGGGKFDWGDTILTAAVFGVFSLAIVAESLVPLLVRAYYSVGNTKTPLFVACATSAFTIVSAIGLIKLFEYGPESFFDFFRHFLKVGSADGIAIIGISWAFAIGGMMQMTFLFFFLASHAAREFAHDVRLVIPWSEFFRIAWVSLLAGIAAFGTLRTVNIFISLDTFAGVFIQGAASFAAGAIIYGGVLYFLGNQEVLELVGTVGRRIFRRDILPQELDGTTPEPQ